MGIGRYRQTPLIRWIHGWTEFFEASYENSGTNFELNGELSLIKRLAKAEPKMVLDVGANVGEWMELAFAHWPQCYIHAFEVAPATFETLKERERKRQDDGRCTLNGMGLSDSTGIQQMYFYPDDPYLTSDSHRHTDRPVVSFDANLCTGDEYLSRTGIGRVDFLKIDVEGAEHRVLKGFSKALASGTIQCLQFEYGPFSIQTKFLLIDYYALLADQFWVGKIYQNHVEFADYDFRREHFRFADFCCVHRSRSDLRDLLAG